MGTENETTACEHILCAHAIQLTPVVYHRHFSNTCSAFGLKISVKKTVIMSHGIQVAKITLDDEALEAVENFSYLGSIMSHNFSLDKELNTRLGKVYHACVLSILLYGA